MSVFLSVSISTYLFLLHSVPFCSWHFIPEVTFTHRSSKTIRLCLCLCTLKIHIKRPTHKRKKRNINRGTENYSKSLDNDFDNRLNHNVMHFSIFFNSFVCCISFMTSSLTHTITLFYLSISSASHLTFALLRIGKSGNLTSIQKKEEDNNPLLHYTRIKLYNNWLHTVSSHPLRIVHPNAVFSESQFDAFTIFLVYGLIYRLLDWMLS